ncbi:ROK family protein [Acidobacteriota bacterium]
MSLFAGFDLGGTQLKYGLINDKGTTIFQTTASTPPKVENLILLLKDIWDSLSKKGQTPIAAAGYGFPGIFSSKEQKIIQSPNYPELDNFELRPALSRFMDAPFFINNDANMSAYGELKFGAGQGVQSLVLITIGTGVGSGIILDGRLWQGACGFAGEMGHITVNPEGEKCRCGSQGCLETEVSASKILKNYQTACRFEEDLTAEEVFFRAQKGDSAARKAFVKAGRYLGIGLASVINFLNPEKILLGGGVMRSGDFLFLPALKEARSRSYRSSFLCCSIEKTRLKNKAGFIGAGFWAKDQLNSS